MNTNCLANSRVTKLQGTIVASANCTPWLVMLRGTEADANYMFTLDRRNGPLPHQIKTTGKSHYNH